jgi:hypothetical protein
MRQERYQPPMRCHKLARFLDLPTPIGGVQANGG